MSSSPAPAATGPIAAASANAVELADVRFAYDTRTILDGISMTIPRGKVVAIMGGSGCGKTTILRLIGGQLRPLSGRVLVDGQSVPDLDREALYAMRRRIGMLFQFGALFTDMTVYENVAFAMREHTDLPEELIRDLVLMKLHAVGLRGAAQLKPSELSGGMARRVALARAVALDPMMVMYDEPFAGLDPISLGVVGELIRRLNDALGTTSVVVTHDVYESLKIVDYLYFVSDGRIVAQGTPADVRDSGEAFVRQFVDGAAGWPGALPLPGGVLPVGTLRPCLAPPLPVLPSSSAAPEPPRSPSSAALATRPDFRSRCSRKRRRRFAACRSRCGKSTSPGCCR